MHARIDRRGLLLGAAAGAGLTVLPGCSGASEAYDEAVARMTAPLPEKPDALELIRFATLAANGHNAQPWRFAVGESAIGILPDFGRRTPVVDPDDHHLFASLGCAAENLSLAARARGQDGTVTFDAAEEGRLDVSLAPVAPSGGALFEAIPHRQCTRAVFDGRTAPTETVDRIVHAAAHHGVDALYISEPARVEQVLALVVEGNGRQVDDPDFVRELKHWIRFNATHAVASGDGLYTGASGNPTLPAWLGSTMFGLFFTKEAENQKYVEHTRSSSGLVVFVSDTDGPAGWIRAGRAYQRAALQATADGLKQAFLNQAVEVPEMRAELRGLLGLGDRRPNLVIRVGYGDRLPRSLRRPVRDVLV